MAAVALFAIGIGAVMALFGPVTALILSPLPFRRAGQLVYIGAPILNIHSGKIAGQTFLNEAFSDVAAYWAPRPDWIGQRTQVRTVTVTPRFFQTLGVKVRNGRGLAQADSSGTYAVISNALWRDRGHRGGELNLASGRFRIVGVAPPGFGFPSGTQVWELARKGGPRPDAMKRSWVVFARLRNGVSQRAAATRVRAAARRRNHYGFVANGPTIEPLRSDLRGAWTGALWGLWAAAFACLLLACAGAGSLMLTRNLRRRGEIAIRLALGARRRTLVTAAFAEALTLAAGGYLLGVGAAEIARYPLAAMVRARIGAPVTAAGPSAAVIAIAGAALAVCTAVIAGVGPALFLVRTDPNQLIHGGLGPNSGRGWFQRHESLATVQIALALVLLMGTAMLAQSTVARLRTPLGFTESGVAVISAAVPPLPSMLAANAALQRWTPGVARQLQAAVKTEAARDLPLYRKTETALKRLPGVAGVGILDPPPFSRRAIPLNAGFYRADPSRHGWGNAVRGWQRFASPNIFHLLGIQLLRGRTFSLADAAVVKANMEQGLHTGSFTNMAPAPVIVNQSLAAALWPHGNAIDRIFYGPQALRVIGVAGNVRETAARLAPTPTVYELARPGALHFIVRLRTSARFPTFAPSAAQAIAGVSPLIVSPAVLSLAAEIARASSGPRLALELLGLFALFGAAVACLGIHSTCQELAASQIRAFAIRMALGASPRQIYATFAWRSARMILVALLPAGLGLWLLEQALANLRLRGTGGPTHPTGLIAAVVLLSAPALAIGLRSARRIARNEPASMLRAE